MLTVRCNKLERTLEVDLPLTAKEQKVFSHIRAVCDAAPTPIAARIAGGWVRDKLLPLYRPDVPVKSPKDIDIALDSVTGEEFAELLEQYDRRYTRRKAKTTGLALWMKLDYSRHENFFTSVQNS